MMTRASQHSWYACFHTILSYLITSPCIPLVSLCALLFVPPPPPPLVMLLVLSLFHHVYHTYAHPHLYLYLYLHPHLISLHQSHHHHHSIVHSLHHLSMIVINFG